MLNFSQTRSLVDSAVAAGTTSVTRPTDGFRHLFLVDITALGTVWIEGAVEAVAPAVPRWIPVSDSITVTDCIAVEGVFPLLRVAWSGNTGTITVDYVKSSFNPDQN